MSFLQSLHGDMRWLIVLVGLVALVRHAVGLFGGQKYDAIGRISFTILNALVGIQFLLGLTLLIWKVVAIGASGNAQYWGEVGAHAVIMFITIGLIGGVSGRVKRAATDQEKWRIGTVGMLIVAVLIFVGVMSVRGWGIR